jgi:hypothetical protein
MAAISAIPDILNVVVGDYKAFPGKAGEAIVRGTLLAYNSSGMLVKAPTYTTAGVNGCVGVAMDDAAIYKPVTVIYSGVVNVANGDDTTAIAIGKSVMIGGYAGAVLVAQTSYWSRTNIVGTVMDAAIAGNSYGKIMLQLGGK